MKCPFCNQEMEKGYMQTQCATWTKSIHKMLLIPQEGEVMLYNRRFSYSHYTSYICKSCQKIIIDYANESTAYMGTKNPTLWTEIKRLFINNEY